MVWTVVGVMGFSIGGEVGGVCRGHGAQTLVHDSQDVTGELTTRRHATVGFREGVELRAGVTCCGRDLSV